jgi:hypothetical protein
VLRVGATSSDWDWAALRLLEALVAFAGADFSCSPRLLLVALAGGFASLLFACSARCFDLVRLGAAPVAVCCVTCLALLLLDARTATSVARLVVVLVRLLGARVVTSLLSFPRLLLCSCAKLPRLSPLLEVAFVVARVSVMTAGCLEAFFVCVAAVSPALLLTLVLSAPNERRALRLLVTGAAAVTVDGCDVTSVAGLSVDARWDWRLLSLETSPYFSLTRQKVRQ